jgi:sulfur relay (sulfurtransferase) complex TusBCD TusD component (DsrE family)
MLYALGGLNMDQALDLFLASGASYGMEYITDSYQMIEKLIENQHNNSSSKLSQTKVI